jgi:hypothetical protein
MIEPFCPVVLIYLVWVDMKSIRMVAEARKVAQPMYGFLSAYFRRVDPDELHFVLAIGQLVSVLHDE